jgi:hypothetical protein
MTSWNEPDLAGTPFDLRLLDWLRDHPEQSAHQIAVSLGITSLHSRGTPHVVGQALKRLKIRGLVRDEDKISPASRHPVRYWSAA